MSDADIKSGPPGNPGLQAPTAAEPGGGYRVLARKYRLLRVAYTIFMWGLIATVIAFAAASLAGDFIVTNNPTVIDY